MPHNTVWQRAILLTQKELRETLRDRRTIITLLAMPLLLYPLLGMVFRFMAVSQMKGRVQPEYTVVLRTEVEVLWMRMAVAVGQDVLARDAPVDSAVSGGEGAVVAAPITEDLRQQPKLSIVCPKDAATFDLREAIGSLSFDVGAAVQLDNWNGRVSELQSAHVLMTSCPDSASSREAVRYLQECLRAANLSYMVRVARSVDPAVQFPVRTSWERVGATQRSRGFLGLLPLVLLLMTVTGGVYPAIDLTAGERERDTLETLVSLPIPRVHLLMGKYVAVFTVTMLTGIVNLLAMTATVYSLRMESQLFGEEGITFRLTFALVGILMVFGLFYSAVLLALTSSSRSFKEAQAYLIPLMLMSLAPGLSILLPGWNLRGAVTILPLVNMLLLARDVFEGTVQLVPAAVAVGSTLLYACGALYVAAQIFGMDAIAVGSRGSWADLIRRPAAPAQSLPLSAAMATLGLLFPLYFFANGLLSRTADAEPAVRLVTSGVLTIALFWVIPAGVLWWRRVSMGEGWLLKRASLLVWPAALLIGISAWPLVYELVLLTQHAGLFVLDPDRLKLVSAMLEKWRAVPLPLMVLCLGVIPGIFEELFFRGFLLSAMRRRLKKPACIFLCGILFGAFHVIAAEGATLERLLPSSVLGWLLTWIAVRTGSVLPGMLLHVCHNSTLLSIAYFRDDFANMTVGGLQQEHLPGAWLVASGIAVVVAVLWISFRTRSRGSLPKTVTPKSQ